MNYLQSKLIAEFCPGQPLYYFTVPFIRKEEDMVLSFTSISIRPRRIVHRHQYDPCAKLAYFILPINTDEL